MSDVLLRAMVKRWKRFGHDRLYVTAGDGAPVGWWDLATDEAHPERPDRAPALEAAVRGWRVEHPVAAPDAARATPPGGSAPAPPRAVVDPTPVAEVVPVVRPWIDLTANSAGERARERALATRSAAPVRTFVARVLGVHTEERAWRIGADGEELVAAQLTAAAEVDPRWRFVHAVPVGDRGADIDHVVVGPGGVFTLNAKHHPGATIWVGGSTFVVNGTRTPYLRNSRFEAARAARLLTAACGFPVHVEGVVVPVGTTDVTVRTAPTDLGVVPLRSLTRWLLVHGDVLDDDVLHRIFDAARRSTTWRP